MKIVQINCYRELDELIARKLGWVESSFYEECCRSTPGAQWSYGTDGYVVEVTLLFPPEVVEAGEEEDWAFEHEHWCSDNGGSPLFSRNWEDTEILLEKCEEHNFIFEWFRTNEIISCSINQIGNNCEHKKIALCSYTSQQFEIPKSMPLATCLAWLLWHDIKIEFNLTLSR